MQSRRYSAGHSAPGQRSVGAGRPPPPSYLFGHGSAQADADGHGGTGRNDGHGVTADAGNLSTGHGVLGGVGEPFDAVTDVTADEAVTRYRDAFLEHRGRLVGMAVLLGAPNSTVEDVVDDAFAAAFGPWRAGRVDDLRAYLRRSVINGVYSQGRHEQARSRWLARQRSVHDVDPADDRLVEHQRLVVALRRLPIELRTAVVLRFCEDLTEQDAATAMGVAVGTVKSRTARGLDRLRSLLEEDHDA
jgi:RNA polymerase sigma factor (sigma-70 family)